MSTHRQSGDDRPRGAWERSEPWRSDLDPTGGAESGAGLLTVWLVTATVLGLGLLLVAIGVVALRLPPGALLGTWLLANGLMGLLTLLSAVVPAPPLPSTERH
jgi:hypothetical protein